MSNNTKSVNWFIDQLNVYQSANSDYQSIKNNFIIRKHEFETIINSMLDKKGNDPLQHELILGRRGSGKSTLLKRIEIEIVENEKLNKKYIAINLAEEQAGIYRLFDLWEQVLEELKYQQDLSLELKNFSDLKTEDAFAKYLYQQIHIICKKLKKKVVLLLDNFDRILENQGDDGNLLRETLINYNDIQIIGGSTRMHEHFWQYDKPFYEFFRRHRLEALSQEEMYELLEHWSNALEIPELNEFIKNNPGKLENIRLLTDGLPRTLQFFIQIVLQKTETEVYGFVKKIMDNTTPLFQERLNSLTAPLRKMVLEMAFIWEACSTKQLVEKLRMPSKLVSANLNMLVDKGIIEKIATDKKMHLYRLAERFFNMWLVVTQGNPEQKRKVKFLSLFIENWYNKQEIKDLVKKHIDGLSENNTSWQQCIVFSKALSQSRYISMAERDTIIELTEKIAPKLSKETLIQLPKKAKEIWNTCQKLFEEGKYKEAIKQLNEIENEEGGLKFFGLGYIYDELKERNSVEKYYLLAVENGSKGATYNLAFWYHQQGKFDAAEKYYLLAVENGINRAMNNLALLYERQEKFELAEKYYLLAVEKGVKEAIYNLALLYQQEGKFEAAEKYYLLAVEKGDKEAMNNLALLYYDTNKNKKEAINVLNQLVKGVTHSSILENQIIIEIWNGIFNDLENRVFEIVKTTNGENIDEFLKELLIQQQRNLVLKLFISEQWGKVLQEKYLPLYYAVLILNNKTEDNLLLKIPPELQSTVDEIIQYIKEKEKFYGYN